MNALTKAATKQDTKHDNLIAWGCGVAMTALVMAFVIQWTT